MAVDTSHRSGGLITLASRKAGPPSTRNTCINHSRGPEEGYHGYFHSYNETSTFDSKTLPLQPSKAIMRRSYPPVMTHQQ